MSLRSVELIYRSKFFTLFDDVSTAICTDSAEKFIAKKKTNAREKFIYWTNFPKISLAQKKNELARELNICVHFSIPGE